MARHEVRPVAERSCDDIPGEHGPHCAPCWWHVYKARLAPEAHGALVDLWARLKPFACQPKVSWGRPVPGLEGFVAHCFWKWRNECFQLDECATFLTGCVDLGPPPETRAELVAQNIEAWASAADEDERAKRGLDAVREAARTGWPEPCEGGR